MTSALVKLNIQSRMLTYIRFKAEHESVKLQNSKSYYAINISGGQVLNSKEEIVEDLEPGKKYKVVLGTVDPVKYHLEVASNGALKHHIQPTISFERLEPDKGKKEIALTFTALKALKVSEVTHWLSLYMLD